MYHRGGHLGILLRLASSCGPIILAKAPSKHHCEHPRRKRSAGQVRVQPGSDARRHLDSLQRMVVVGIANLGCLHTVSLQHVNHGRQQHADVCHTSLHALLVGSPHTVYLLVLPNIKPLRVRITHARIAGNTNKVTGHTHRRTCHRPETDNGLHLFVGQVFQVLTHASLELSVA